MPCLFKPDMHHTCLCIMPCLCEGCLPCCMLLSSLLLSLASVLFRSCEDSFDYVVRLLHGFGLLPSEISSNMTVTLDITTIFALLVVSMLSLCRATYHLVIKPPKYAMKQPLTFFTIRANRCLAMLPLCSAPLIALLVAGAVVVCSMLGHGYHGYLGISQYLLFN